MVSFISCEERSCNTVTDSACLTCDTAADNVYDDVELACSVGYAERLVDDELQCFESEVIVNVTTVDSDLACTGIKSYASNGAFSSARTLEISFSSFIHILLPSLSYISTSYGTGF